jgi:Ca2+-binding EF-hand superfamily protein
MAIKAGRQATSSPVPSITLSITQDDVKRVLDASKAMTETLASIQKQIADTSAAERDGTELSQKPSNTTNQNIKDSSEPSSSQSTSSNADENTCAEDGVSKLSNEKGSKRPLHELIFEAARQCQHSMLRSFLEKMKCSGSSSREIRAGVLVFYEGDLKAKMKLIFDILGTQPATSGSDKENCEKTLNREGILSLFRSVIVAISSCIHQDPRVQIEIEGQPRKKMKLENTSPRSECTGGSHDHSAVDSVPDLKSPSASFDSSLATKEEEDFPATATVRKEFEEIATYATECLVKYVQKKATATKNDPVAISFSTFGDWNDKEGENIAPWLDLLNLSKWRTPARPTSRPPIPPRQLGNVKQEKSPQYKPEPQLSARKPIPIKPTPAKASATKVERLRATSPAYFEKDNSSRTVVSFDFTSSAQDANPESDFCINISEENLLTLRNLVRVTGLSGRQPQEIANILIGASKSYQDEEMDVKVIPIERFHTCLHQLLGSGSARRLSKIDKDVFSSSFVDFFSCFNTGRPPLQSGEANARELAVGFCFLCSGNKSSKLASGFEILQSANSEGLTTKQLAQFLRSYLTMLVGISLLTSSSEGIMKPKLNSARRKSMYTAIENGAKWTLSHYLKHVENTGAKASGLLHTFEAFADWYTAGGYNVAPWLELLDLKKLLSLIGDNAEMPSKSPQMMQDALPLPPFSTTKTSTPQYLSPRRPRTAPTSGPYSHQHPPSPAEVLFTFPLANRRSLVVLREDATYVRGVVDQLDLLSFTPDDIWSSLYNNAVKQTDSKNSNCGKSIPVNRTVFIQCMEETINAKHNEKKRLANGSTKSVSGAREVLINFFHSFDLHQVDSVALNELMGGLSLLCGGKKSTKLAFAFGVFDQRSPQEKRGGGADSNPNSIGGEDLFLFLRSFLIVMFSCCRQSWDLSDDAVNRYIADTTNLVTDDVMRYQWKTRKKNRVDFDEFGQWYNEGGFETAPWLELLDLRKWVLVDNFDSLDTLRPEASLAPASPGLVSSPQLSTKDMDCPPPPPDDEVDASFFDDDANGILPMESIDEMDLILMQPSQDKESDSTLSQALSYSPTSQLKPPAQSLNPNTLKFHLVVDDDHGGYIVSVSQKRISHLRQVLMQSGLYCLDGEMACKQILGKAFVDEKSNRRTSYSLTKDDFDSAMRGVITGRSMSVETQRTLSEILSEIFSAFDYDGTGRVNAIEIACGFTVLCKGKKSDKLEYAFEVLDKDRRGKLSKTETTRYLRSFLTVLLNIVSTNCLDCDFEEDVMTTTGGMRCERTMSTMARAVEAGSTWASSQAFQKRKEDGGLICFDEFAEWYTHVGYSNIPWLELLDLQKWVINVN